MNIVIVDYKPSCGGCARYFTNATEMTKEELVAATLGSTLPDYYTVVCGGKIYWRVVGGRWAIIEDVIITNIEVFTSEAEVDKGLEERHVRLNRGSSQPFNPLLVGGEDLK